MSEWKSVCEMPENFFGDVWVFSKHLKEPELAYTSLAGRRHGKLGGERLFQEIHAVFDADGVHKEYYEDVSHYMVVIPPAPPVMEANANLIAAAPELYEACDECLHALRTLIVHGELSDGSIDYLEKKLNAALDKADGEQKARGE